MWKNLYLELNSSCTETPSSLIECITDSATSGHFSSLYDSDYAKRATIYGIYSLVWECRQSYSLSLWHEPVNLGHVAFVQESYHQRLLQFLSNVRSVYDSDSSEGFSTRYLALDLLNMHMFTPFELIELFAGKEGSEEARLAHKGLKKWAVTRRSRHAVWHAGQVFRVTQQLPPEHRNGFHAIALYQASITLWAFAILGPMSRHSQRDDVSKTTEIFVDGLESAEVQRWIRFKHGLPAIRHMCHADRPDQISTPLYDAGGVLNVARGILMRTFARESDTSFLVENIGRFMQELEKVSQKIR
ncbi:hypothetical protein K469DRAFT_55367 [Zopfia rhizophila CBS 207.26]|uniref:Transcription factor domain-containing protein n=1 Tax=Zopfia rhizophila CBS 207.26 TaxID=1314779 RepID=A0A6A6D8B2_9PEZI|nr:hypothetical protein K469DRAFT_55367 [Zopfia rhizophila CBS 207.26]